MNLAPSHASWRGELGATLRLAGPMALANLLQMLTYAIDVIFIARLGDEPLAASALAVAVFGLVSWTLSGLVGAVAPVIAAELGADAAAVRPVRRATRMALWLALMAGVAGMGICLLVGPLARVTGQQPHIAELAEQYMSVLAWALVPMVLANVLRQFVSTLGRPIFATLIIAAGIGVNALGNYAFIFGHFGAPAMGLVGAGIATIATTLITLFAYAVVILADPRLHRYRVLARLWQPDWARLTQLLRIGAPIALTVLAEAGIFGAAAFLMGRFGAAALAGHTLALQLATLSFQVPFGVSQAATIRVGYYYGAGDRDGIRRAGWVALAIGTGCMGLMGAAMVLAPLPLLSIYVDPALPANAALVGFAMQYLVVAAGFQLVDGIQVVAAGALRGLQDTRVPMWIAVFAYWVPGIGTALALGFATPLQGVGVWLGLAMGLVVSAVLLIWRWSMRERLGLTRYAAPSAGS